MSLVQPECSDCAVPCECEHVAWFTPDVPGLFGVAWKCPSCDTLKLVVSPLGPRDIGPATCLHCGAEENPGAAPCSACGTSLQEVLTADELALPDEALLALAREAFALGTCKRGLTLVNHALRRDESCEEARSIKAQFIEHLDAQEPFARPELAS
jgi:hypothetical protein